MHPSPAIQEKIFRTYDVRGRVPRELSPETVELVGRALAAYFRRGRIILAHDGRESAKMLYPALVRGFETQRGLRLVKIHLATTPLFSFLVHTTKARGGVIVTASHNPKEYNGLKVAERGALPIGGKEVLQITKRFLKHHPQ